MWMRRDWTRAGFATLAAFSLTAGGYWFLGATPKDAQAPTAVISQPTLMVDGCQIKAHLASNTPNMVIQPGPIPAFALDASNPGTTPATIHFSANLRVSNIRDTMSRVPRLPSAPVWSQDFTMTLQPGQTLSTPITVTGKVNSGDIAELIFENGKQQIAALTFNAAFPAVTVPPVNGPAAAVPDAAKQLVAQGEPLTR